MRARIQALASEPAGEVTPARISKSRIPPAHKVAARAIKSRRLGAEAGVSSIDLVMSDVVRALYEGRVLPGQRLVESDFTQRLGVGRGTVREALHRLAAGGLVSMSRHRGASIQNFTRDAVRDLLETTEILAGSAARLAAERLHRAEDAADLRRAVDELAEAVRNGDLYMIGRIRWRFWQELVALTGNQDLARLLMRFENVVARIQFRAAFDLEGERRDLAQFQQVATLVLVRDGATAERLIRQHIRDSSFAIQQMPDHHFAV